MATVNLGNFGSFSLVAITHGRGQPQVPAQIGYQGAGETALKHDAHLASIVSSATGGGTIDTLQSAVGKLAEGVALDPKETLAMKYVARQRIYNGIRFPAQVDVTANAASFVTDPEAGHLMDIADESIIPEALLLLDDSDTTPGKVTLPNEAFRCFTKFGADPQKALEYTKCHGGGAILIQALLQDNFDDPNYNGYLKVGGPVGLSTAQLKQLKSLFLEAMGPDPAGKLPFDPEAFDAFMVYMGVSDIGKSHKFQNFAKEVLGLESVDHDKLLYQALEKAPWASPSYDRQSDEYKRIDRACLKAQSRVNIPQIFQGEAADEMVETMAEGLSEIWALGKDSKRALQFLILHVFFDVAGARAFENPTKAGLAIQPIYKTFMTFLDVLTKRQESGVQWDTKEFTKSLLEQILKDKGIATSFDRNSRAGMGKTRILLSTRVSNQQQADAFDEVFAKQPEPVQTILLRDFGISGVDGDQLMRLYYYAPELFAKIANRIAGTSTVDGKPKQNPVTIEHYKQALDVYLPLMARISQEVAMSIKNKEQNGKAGVGRITIQLLKVANAIKDGSVSPDQLKDMRVKITPKGDSEVEFS